ncbi:hypothetical protein HanRHA438_Chr09g0420621 [Helianthus annuus]|nr:hypothetical protein HanRHA438_Chr09g0420621 [Helianthus annuus]
MYTTRESNDIPTKKKHYLIYFVLDQASVQIFQALALHLEMTVSPITPNQRIKHNTSWFNLNPRSLVPNHSP